MASYYYGSGLTWAGYLQADSFVRDVTGQIKKSGEATRHEISAQTREVVASNERLTQEFGRGFDAVNGTLEMGFGRLESALGDVEASIESLHSDFNYNMGLVLDQLQIQNQLTFGILERLDAIHKTLEHPELTKAREFYNRGCERLSKGLLDKALEAFLNAEEKNDTDFFIQFQIGKLYLYGIDEDDNVIDLPKAEKHLRDAARYGKAEIAVMPEFKRWTGEALLHASIACYAQANDQRVNGDSAEAKEFISKAFQLAQQACEIYPSLSESQYHLAKYAALLGDVETSVQSLEKAVTTDVNYYLKIEFDRDFDAMRPQVFDLFERLRVKLGEKARKQMQECKQKYITDVVYLADEAKNVKNEISNLLSNVEIKINTNTLFELFGALQLLNQIEPAFLKISLFIEKYSIKNIRFYIISPECKFIATGPPDEEIIKLWRVSDGKLIHTLKGKWAHSFSPDCNIFVSCDGQNVKLWNVNDGKLIHKLLGKHIRHFSRDGKFITTDDGENVVKLWQVSNGKLMHKFLAQFGGAFSPDGKFIITYYDGLVVKLWQVSNGKLMYKLPGATWRSSFSSDGKIIATQDGENVKLWQVSDGKPILTLLTGIYYSGSSEPFFSSDGKIIATQDCENVKLWQVSDGKLMHTILGGIWPSPYSPDGKFIIVFDGRSVNLWQIDDGKLIITLPGQPCSFSPDGKFIATIDERTAKIWQVDNEKLLQTLPRHSRYDSVYFSPDWKYFISKYGDTIRLWERSVISRQEIKRQESLEKDKAQDVKRRAISTDKRRTVDIDEHRLREERKRNGLCLVCGAKLSFFDKLRGRTTCPKHP